MDFAHIIRDRHVQGAIIASPIVPPIRTSAPGLQASPSDFAISSNTTRPTPVG
jgi:hypothetical protein